MTTPEGTVKAAVRAILKEHNVYYLQPVQMGYGPAGVDFHCVIRWKDIPVAFFIETKAPDKDFTERQKLFAENREKDQNATTFKIKNQAGLRKLEQWLEALHDQSSLLKPRLPSLTITTFQPKTP